MPLVYEMEIVGFASPVPALVAAPEGKSGPGTNVHQHLANAERRANSGVICMHFFTSIGTWKRLQCHRMNVWMCCSASKCLFMYSSFAR